MIRTLRCWVTKNQLSTENQTPMLKFLDDLLNYCMQCLFSFFVCQDVQIITCPVTLLQLWLLVRQMNTHLQKMYACWHAVGFTQDPTGMEDNWISTEPHHSDVPRYFPPKSIKHSGLRRTKHCICEHMSRSKSLRWGLKEASIAEPSQDSTALSTLGRVVE